MHDSRGVPSAATPGRRRRIRSQAGSGTGIFPGMPVTAQRLDAAWRRLYRFPGGRWLFTRLLARAVPYSGTVRPRVLALEPGVARLTMADHRRVRNHLGSIHAIALGNLAELASGLAMTMALPPDVRGIPIRIEIDYLKKARGGLVAVGRADPPAVADVVDAAATAELRDREGDVVARAVVTWRLAPRD